MYKINIIDGCYINKYIFLIDTEDLEGLIDLIYNDISKLDGSTFKIIVDCFVRTGYSYNRFIELSFIDGNYFNNIIINSRDIPTEIKDKSNIILKSNFSILEHSALSSKAISLIKDSLKL